MGRRRLLLLLGSGLLSLLLLEGGARLQYRVAEGEAFPVDSFRERLAPDANPAPKEASLAAPRSIPGIDHKALHPYLGYVHDPTLMRARANRLGFPGPDPLAPAEDDAPRVALLGGSVALQLFREGGDALRAEIARAAGLAEGSAVHLYALSIGGYKQPQQLMALAWMLGQGAEFDIAINLDGFNEVALPYVENVPRGVHPGYPRGWSVLAASGVDGAAIEQLVRLRALQEARVAWRARLGSGWPARSAFVLRLLDRIDADHALRIAEVDARFAAVLDKSGRGFASRGPAFADEGEDALFDALASQWREASRQIAKLSAANGIAYLHFLQPNQYVSSSKPFTADERRLMRTKGEEYRAKRAVVRGYPKLQLAGAALQREGVDFHDLTGLFAAETRTVYRDGCCHFNRLGVQQLAEAIGHAAGKALASRAAVE